MDSVQKLIKKAKEMGINTDEVVYSVCVGDVIEVIAETFENILEENIEYALCQLKDLIETGVRGCENIDWSGPIEHYLCEKMKFKVFVYGTLRKGCSNHSIMDEAFGEFIGNGTIEGYEMYTNGYFPMIIRGKGIVTGEVYNVANLQRLDRLEGYPHMYIREIADVKLENGETVKALVYTQSHNSEVVKNRGIRIPEGDWLEWLRKEREANARV